MAEPERILKEAPILERIQKIRMKLSGTDRDDHLEIIESWDRKARKALIFMALQGHEGIEMLRERAQNEIREINIALTMPRDSDTPFDIEILAGESMARQDLIHQRRLWEWFLGLFTEAQEDIQTINADLDVQEEPDVSDEG